VILSYNSIFLNLAQKSHFRIGFPFKTGEFMTVNMSSVMLRTSQGSVLCQFSTKDILVHLYTNLLATAPALSSVPINQRIIAEIDELSRRHITYLTEFDFITYDKILNLLDEENLRSVSQ
jgi:hypothetical protein